MLVTVREVHEESRRVMGSVDESWLVSEADEEHLGVQAAASKDLMAAESSILTSMKAEQPELPLNCHFEFAILRSSLL